MFGKVFFGQDLFNPGIDGEGVDVVESEEADAVGDLGTDAIEAGKCGHVFHGLAVLHGFQIFQVQNSGRGVLGQAVDVFGAVAEF